MTFFTNAAKANMAHTARTTTPTSCASAMKAEITAFIMFVVMRQGDVGQVQCAAPMTRSTPQFQQWTESAEIARSWDGEDMNSTIRVKR